MYRNSQHLYGRQERFRRRNILSKSDFKTASKSLFGHENTFLPLDCDSKVHRSHWRGGFELINFCDLSVRWRKYLVYSMMTWTYDSVYNLFKHSSMPWKCWILGKNTIFSYLPEYSATVEYSTSLEYSINIDFFWWVPRSYFTRFYTFLCLFVTKTVFWRFSIFIFQNFQSQK